MERDVLIDFFNQNFTNFNSHAHVERDTATHTEIADAMNFNSHAHVERDGFGTCLHSPQGHFNSHAHVERDFTTPFLDF